MAVMASASVLREEIFIPDRVLRGMSYVLRK